MLYGLDGKVTDSIPEIKPKVIPFTVTRQLKRAYLRVCALSEINQLYGLEPRRLRRSMAFTLAKRPYFIDKVREATHAF